MKSIFQKMGVSLIGFYQKRISPFKPKSCRFYPTCSEYTKQAIKKYGFFNGVVLGAKRLVKCHPFHPGGNDPLS